MNSGHHFRDKLKMAEAEPGTVWEMYSSHENRWTRVIVTKVEDGQVTLRHEGVLEFITVDGSEMENNRELFRPPSDQAAPTTKP
jgi:hypothetical protein